MAPGRAALARVRRDELRRLTDAEALVADDDLIVHKALAGRDRDWLDIEGVVIRQGEDLDGDFVPTELARLAELKGSIDAVDRLRVLLGATSR